DLDDPLAVSKAAITPRIAALLRALLRTVDVAIISGGNETQFRSQVIARLDGTDAADLARLHLLPTCGTRYLRHDGSGCATVYAHDLSDDEKTSALAALREEAERLGLWEAEPWG
ncbi:HAD family hydrolase, partial [Photobacterium sanguinicancri]